MNARAAFILQSINSNDITMSVIPADGGAYNLTLKEGDMLEVTSAFRAPLLQLHHTRKPST